ncbi:MAG TPA: ABC-F family ATP-binding cassette domain-containing protein [Longimicrobiales bacterium]|nr:ABC-F family ATP-binding cassette domain-containing protein [Longimicrobiales bacterium]
MISVSNLSKQFGDRTLFENASFQLNAGQRYGLIGANGSGKTTLLNVMSGHLDSTEGHVSIPKRLRLGVLRQDQFLYEDQLVMEVTLMGNPELWAAMVEKEAILEKAETDFDADRFGVLEEIVQHHDGYTAEARAAEILEGLGLPAEVHRRPLSTLSGGFRLRVLLAQVLASNPDVLLLDEPTNHLDILSIRWLEKFLREFAGPVVVISHDHRFLDNVVTDILDVDYRTVTLYKGNYSFFLKAKVEDRERREKEIAGREKEIAHHQDFVDRFKAKASKARQAQSKMKIIEKKVSEMDTLPGSSRRYPTFRFEPKRPSGKEVLRIKGIRKAFGDNEVLHGVDLEVRRGDRLAIMGPNGIGKSTLLKIIMGELKADGGEVTWGYETQTGYFAQDHKETFKDGSRTAEEWLWDFCPGKDRGFVRGQMGMMLFSGDDGAKKLSALSGGEAARLVFSRLAMENPNVLVLDEPTNHLDLESIEALVHGLENFGGTLILVSHDRWFVSRLATRVVEIKRDEVKDYLGTYDEYVHHCGDDHLDADSVVLKARTEKQDRKQAPKAERRPATVDPSVLLNRLTRQRDDLTAKIETSEARVAEIDALFCGPGYFEATPPNEVAALQEERAALQGRANALMDEWAAVEREIEAL